MATPFHLPVTAAQVGTYFVGQYYQVLQHQPDFVHQFYSDASTMLRIDGNTRETATAMLQIHTLVMSLNYTGIEIMTAHSLESWNGGVLVMASGSVHTKDFGGRRKFVQTFFLAPQEKGFFVLNDIFHFIEEEPIHHHPVAYLAQSNLDSKLNASATIREPVSNYMLGGETPAREFVASADIEENGPVDTYNFSEQQLQHTPETESILEDNFAQSNGSLQNSVSPVSDHLSASVEEPIGEPQKHTYASIVSKGQSATSAPPQPSFNKSMPPASEWDYVPEPPTQQSVASSIAVESSGAEAAEEFSAFEDEGEIKSVYVRILGEPNSGCSNMATYTPKNILITGAAGFIACHVANRLIRNYPEYKIVVLDKLDYCSNLKNLLPSRSSPNFKFVKGDIGSADLVNFLLITESIDTIMHFAAQTHVDNSFGNSFEFTKNNIYGTHVLLEACKVTGQIRRFIHVSTDEVYGETDEDAVVGNHEASQLLPTNPYSATKAGAEMLVMAYGRSYGLPVITTRGNNVYGPNQFPEKLIPKFILLAMQGKPLPIHGDGANVRSYLYCEDVAEAFEVVLHKGEVGHVYNIGTKKERRVTDVARNICKLFSMDPETSIKFVENRPFNDQRYFLDDQKLKNLGWSERTTWEEGLKKTMEWYINNPDWWGDVSGALLPHPRMLMMPGGIERHFDGAEKCNDGSSHLSSANQNRMVLPVAKSSGSPRKPPLKFLIFGRTGWIGGLLGKICEKQGIPYEYGRGRLEDRSLLLADIQNVKPTHVFNAAGVTGRPNVDWCETHKTETIRTNVAGTLNLADVCREHGLLMMNFATGCIFEYDAAHPEGSGIGYKEEDTPNFAGSFYSKTKAMVEELLKEYDNVCTLRVRMPISSDLSNPRNFITKISRYNKVVNIPNSMTILDELLPISIEMAKRNLRGIWNFTNPGVVSHNEILEMYKRYINPDFKWANFTLEEQAKVIVAARSNNEMDASKLKKEFPELLPIKESLIKYVFEPSTKNSAE